MIIRQTPMDKENYVLISDSSTAIELQKKNIFPKYMDNDGLYFVKTVELEMFLLDKIQG